MNGLTRFQWISRIFYRSGVGLAMLLSVSLCACSSTKAVVGTEQLLMSDAVDRTVSEFDFRPLSGHRVFLDTAFIVPNRNPAQLVNTDYVISSLRQQMISSGCLLVANRDEADVVAEARLGALGTDGQMIIYGIPENNFLNRAASVIPNSPQVPSIPEVALAKKDLKSASAKLAVFAYDRQTLEPIWQSGLVQSESKALDTWVMGIGPFRRGTIQDGVKIAENRRLGNRPLASMKNSPDDNPLVSYSSEWVYSKLPVAEKNVQTASDNGGNAEAVTKAGGSATVTTATGTNTISANDSATTPAVPAPIAASNSSPQADNASTSSRDTSSKPVSGTTTPALK